LPLVTKDGQEIAVEFVSNLYRVNGSKVIQCNIRNITARKWVEKKLRVSEDKYRSMVMNAVEGIFQSTEEGQPITVNPALAKMLVYCLINDRSYSFSLSEYDKPYNRAGSFPKSVCSGQVSP